MSESKSALKVAFFTIFLDLLGFGIVIPVQAFYAESFGASPTLITLLGASYSIMQFLFTPFWGRLSDRVGRRPIILSSVAIGTVAYVVFGFASSLPLLFAARMLAGFGNANLATAQAIIADSTTAENRSKGMGLIGAAFGLGFIFGPALGGVMGHFYGPRAPAFAAAALGALNLLFAFKKLPETLKPQAPGEVKPSTHGFAALKILGRAIKMPSIPVVLCTTLLYTTAFAAMEQVIGILIESFWILPKGLAETQRIAESTRMTSIFLVVTGVTLTIVQGGLIGKLTKRFGERKLLMFGLGVVGICLALIPLIAGSGSFVTFLGLGSLLAFGAGMVNPSNNSIMSQIAPPTEQGAFLGLNQSLSSLGRVLGPCVAGALFEISPGLPLFIGAALVLVAMVCVVTSLKASWKSGAPAVR